MVPTLGPKVPGVPDGAAAGPKVPGRSSFRL